jgi:hypothetical protein
VIYAEGKRSTIGHGLVCSSSGLLSAAAKRRRFDRKIGAYLTSAVAALLEPSRLHTKIAHIEVAKKTGYRET